MTEPVIEIRNLRFSYSKPPHTCFTNLNLNINKGERFGLFGPNGAGKTTLMSCMTGLLNYSEGNILLFGKELNKHSKQLKKHIGLVPQDFAFYQELSPVENLEFFGALYGMHKDDIKNQIQELLTTLKLEEVQNKQVGQLSGGMKRRVNLAIGIIHRPALLFLDEPTVGVDVETRRDIIDYLKTLNDKGTTLIYTSHQLNEAQELCDHVALINFGEIIADSSPENLLRTHQETQFENLFIKLTGKKIQDV